jgi:hypothetical protein
MHTRYFVLLLGIVLVACSSSTQATTTQQPHETSPPEPSMTPTELLETELPATPVPTDTPQPTPTQLPTETPFPIEFNFTWYENNPILSGGGQGEWDVIKVLEGKVLYVDDVFHMFYTGIGVNSVGIGYAVSSDGLAFTKHADNPILQSDGEGFDAVGVSHGTPLLVADTWMLYYNAINVGEKYREVTAGGSSIGLTTAPDPTGPWSAGQQVLTSGASGEWDSGFIIPNSIVTTEDGYRMYYSAGSDPEVKVMMCGMATSPDGITWTKYDDPTTTQAPFAESDPVMQPGPSAWDSDLVQCRVLKTDKGWEMFYLGWDGASIAATGYAFSPDGVQWSKYADNPILDRYLFYPFAIKVGSTYYLYGHELKSGTLLAATGTIDRR